MRCIQVPNAVKDNISSVIKKTLKKYLKNKSSPCEEGSGKRSETKESEKKCTGRYKRFIMFNMLAESGMATQGGQTQGAFLMDQPRSPSKGWWGVPAPGPSHSPGRDGWRDTSPGDVLDTCRLCFGAPAALKCCCHPLLPPLNNPVQEDLRAFSCHHKNQVHLTRSTTMELGWTHLSSLFLPREEGRKLGKLQSCLFFFSFFSGLNHF